MNQAPAQRRPRRILKRVWTSVVVLSSIVSLAVAGWWVRGYWISDSFVKWRGSRAYVIALREGWATYSVGAAFSAPPATASTFTAATLVTESQNSPWLWLSGPENRKVRLMSPSRQREFSLGVVYIGYNPNPRGSLSVVDTVIVRVWLPLIALLLALPAAAQGGMLIRQRRLARLTAASRCPTCGYDLRATPDRCPECGTVVPRGEGST